MPSAQPLLSIGAVERETGLSKDVLRKWEVRYGFPAPLRDDKGERVYPGDQLDRLRLIKRLLDAGLRPARVVGEPHEVLTDLLERRLPKVHEAAASAFELSFLESLRRHDTPALRRGLYRLALREGLAAFVQNTASRLIATVGDAWARGELEIYEEHLFSGSMQGLLSSLVADLNEDRGRPRVLLTTLPGEPHGLGLLMAAALMSLEGAYCLTLGTQTPAPDICNATQARQIDVVALSFSSLYPARQILPALEELRQGLPPAAEIWVGGDGTTRLGRSPASVLPLTGLGEVTSAIGNWRSRRGPPSDSKRRVLSPGLKG
jgi:hypothetical protein